MEHKIYIQGQPPFYLRELSMLGMENIVKYFKRYNQPKEIEIPPGVILFDYNPAIVRLTKERIREMVPPEIRKEYEELTGICLTEEPKQGQLPEGVEIISFDPKEEYENSKKSNYQR